MIRASDVSKRRLGAGDDSVVRVYGAHNIESIVTNVDLVSLIS